MLCLFLIITTALCKCCQALLHAQLHTAVSTYMYRMTLKKVIVQKATARHEHPGLDAPENYSLDGFLLPNSRFIGIIGRLCTINH